VMSQTGDTVIRQPIFIIGTGRSGTTLFLDLLGAHPDLAWFSNYNERFPQWPWLGMLARVHSLPLANRLLKRNSRYVPRPIESYRMLDRCTNGLFTQHRNLTAGDATAEIRSRFHRDVRQQLHLQAKSRFATKYTGLPRTGFLNAVFPDALFIHVCRDGRAVANSLVRTDWWSSDPVGWRYGDIPTEDMREYEESGRTPIVLAGIAWKILMQQIEAECAALPPDRVLLVRYEDLVRDSVEAMRRAIEFCSLGWTPEFERHVSSQHIHDMDTKWTRQLSEREQLLLQKTIGEALGEHGFC